MILTFSNWKITKSSGTLGYQYDNLTRELAVQGDLPEGWTWDILVSASGNGDTWPLALGDGQASITLTDDNLSVRGEYYLQLRGTNGDQVRHTNVITAYNSRSLSGAGQWPTLPTEWIQAEKDIKELNAHPPVPGSNGYWLLWDLSSHSYQESDLPVPVGPAGPPNVLEIGTVETLPADQPATASITGESPAQKLNLGIPQGKTGETGAQGVQGEIGPRGYTFTPAVDDAGNLSWTNDGGLPNPEEVNIKGPIGATGPQGNPGATPTITAGTVTTLDPGQDATAEITGETPNLTLNLGIPEGQPGKDGVQLNDSAVNTTEAWSSKKIVDTLCPPFSVSGNPVICHPVEGYPLGAVVSLEPKQAGSGDPSPENVRPISGWDNVCVHQSGLNLFDFSKIAFNPFEVSVGNVSVDYVQQTITIAANINNVGYYQTLRDIVGEGLPPGTYVIDAETSSANAQRNIYVLDTKRAIIFGTPTLFSDADLNSKFSWYNAPNNPEPNTISNIRFSMAPTPYEPYQPGTTATLTLPDTIYGGTVDAVTGVGSKTWEFVEFDGTERWLKYPNSNDAVKTFFIDIGVEPYANYINVLCDRARFLTSAWNKNVPWAISSSPLNTAVYITLPNDAASTVEQWKSYLAAQASAGTPVQVAYKLATPETFQATGNLALPAVAGLNTVYTDGDSLAVSGRQDLLYTLQTMQTQTQNLNRFIAEGGTR